jgi:Divergent InlB B-repeat domain
VTMNASKSVTATFTTKPVLTVNKAGSGVGTVTSSPAGIDCGVDCTEAYDEGTPVTLTASPGAAFGGWSGACTGPGTCTVTMDASKSVTATFV